MMLREGSHLATFLALFHHPCIFGYLFHRIKPQWFLSHRRTNKKKSLSD